jgi:bifunctional non-homologous end joining protein LigD
MKALLSEHLPTGDAWVYELKFDGVRGLAVKQKGSVNFISRNNKTLTSRYPDLSRALARIPAKEFMLDGEIVALDPEGKPSFQLLQASRIPGSDPAPLFYYVFDALQLDGRDLTGLPLLRRKEIARSLLEGAGDPIRFSDGILADSERIVKEMQARGLEGLIAKRRDSKYKIGRRSGAWVKFKWTTEQEFVIGGYTAPQGTRAHFGSILVGYYKKGKLMFASKVGTGFDHRLLKSLFDQFQKLRQTACPFSNLPEGSRWSPGLTAAEMRRCTWIKPTLVCQVRFAEWTRDGHLRHPAFLGLREDKHPRDVVRETTDGLR